jgi:urease accessory protein
MHARAHLATEYDGRTRITTLRSEPPFSLRPTRPTPQAERQAEVSVHLAAGAAGPIGGDRQRLMVDVGAGSSLALHDVSATLLLPGPHGEESRLDVDIHVGVGASLAWLPEPVIAARGCRHAATVRVTLDAGARLLLREELLLGRHGEQPGNIRQHLRVTLNAQPLLDQQLALGPDAPASRGPAVTGGHRAIGSLLIVDPAWSHDPPAAMPLDGDAAIMPLSGPAVLVSALCPDGVALRRSLDSGLTLLAPARLETTKVGEALSPRAGGTPA